MTKLREQVKKTDDEVKSMLKDWKYEFSSASMEKLYNEMEKKFIYQMKKNIANIL